MFDVMGPVFWEEEKIMNDWLHQFRILSSTVGVFFACSGHPTGSNVFAAFMEFLPVPSR